MMASVRMVERIEGRGAPALLLHAAASTGEQWRHLARRLAGSHSVVIVDLLGEGKSPPVPAGSPILETELALLEERLCALEEPVALVGHSYGGLLALELARRQPRRVASLVVFEPAVFHLTGSCPFRDEVDRLIRLVAEVQGHLAAGAPRAAAEAFVTYWSGPKAWPSVSPAAQDVISAAIPKLCAGWAEIERLDVPLRAYAELDVPAVLVRGNRGPIPTRWAAAELARTMPNATLREMDGAGHMGPLTHAAAFTTIAHEAVGAHVAA